MTFINRTVSILLNRVVLTLFLAAFFLISSSCSRQLPEKPNIVIIKTDYQAWEDVPELVADLKIIVGNNKKGSEFTGHINFIELEVTDAEN